MTDEVFEYLTRPKETAREIRDIREKRLELLCSLGAKAIRYDLDRVQSAPEDRMAEIMDKVFDLDQKLEILQDRMHDERRELSALFSTLEMLDEKMMRLRYLDGASWEVIAMATHRSQRTNYRRHKEITDNYMLTI